MVVVRHRAIQDPDFGGGLTIKRYESIRRKRGDGTWSHEQIVLRRDSNVEGFRPIVLEPDESQEVRVLGELVAMLG